jgi:lysophospholipase L1-like esterase
VIACLGDSVTHGCFEVFVNHRGEVDTVYEPDSGYPARLKQRLDMLYRAAAVTMLNAGVSGDSAPGGAKRLERDVLARRPDLVVISFGLNDAMTEDVEAGMKRYQQAMDDMLTRVLASGAECIVMTPCHMCSYVPSGIESPLLQEIAAKAARVQAEGILRGYAQSARDAAARHFVAVADAYATWDLLAEGGVDTTSLLSNGINHPSREMHDVFVAELLRTMFQSARPNERRL